jgi:tRNA A37 threonylcarbamoyladenosine modification protein TsaB
MLTVGISTSSGQFALVIGEDRHVLFDSAEWPEPEMELDNLLTFGLKYCEREIKDIGEIIVDNGPGGTSRVRTGIAFANGLAYSLGLSVYPVSSMELAGIEAWSKYKLPVINSVKSIKGNAYTGLYLNGQTTIQYGDIKEIVPFLARDINAFVAVGFHREAILQIPALKDKTKIDSQRPFGNARVLIENRDLFVNK